MFAACYLSFGFSNCTNYFATNVRIRFNCSLSLVSKKYYSSPRNSRIDTNERKHGFSRIRRAAKCGRPTFRVLPSESPRRKIVAALVARLRFQRLKVERGSPVSWLCRRAARAITVDRVRPGSRSFSARVRSMHARTSRRGDRAAVGSPGNCPRAPRVDLSSRDKGLHSAFTVAARK